MSTVGRFVFRSTPFVVGAPRLRGAAAGLALAALASLGGAHDPVELYPHAGLPATVLHAPAGYFAVGDTELTHTGTEYHFTFSGDEDVEYVIDTDSDAVKQGMLSVQEIAVSGGAYPIKAGGLEWHVSDATCPHSPWSLADEADTILIGEVMDADERSLTLTYRDVIPGTPAITAVKSYQFTLHGKDLRIRVRGDASVNNHYDGNYGGVRIGYATEVPNVRQQHIPFMDSIPVILFEPASGPNELAYFSTFVDFYRSNASAVMPWPEPDNSNCDVQPPPSEAEIEFNFGTRYMRSDLGGTSPGELIAPVDDTINLVVTAHISETFPVVPYPQSPYYDLCAPRMGFNLVNDGNRAWPISQAHFEAFADWGMDDVVGNMFLWQKWGLDLMAPDIDEALVMGCDEKDLTLETSETYSWNPGGGTVVSIGVNPDLTANKDLVREVFSDMMEAARDNGIMISLYQDSGHVDQHGNGSSYPTFMLARGQWHFHDPADPPGVLTYLGLLPPAENPAYDSVAYRLVHDWQDVPKTGLHTNVVLGGSTWAGQGHALHVASPTYFYDEYTDELIDVVPDYDPAALFVDETSTEVIDDAFIDQMSASERAHTIWDVLKSRRLALKAHKRHIGGPLFGEGAHWRWRQWDSFEAGLWDGRHRKFPVDIMPFKDADDDGDVVPGVATSPFEPNAFSWVIPDYELTQVDPLASGNMGMGFGWQHWDYAKQTPDSNWDLRYYDSPAESSNWQYADENKKDGKGHRWLDSWWTTLLTYGHSAFIDTTGHNFVTSRSMEGILREYYLVTGLQAAQRASSVEHIYYATRDGSHATDELLTLDEALAEGSSVVDLKRPCIQIEYASGLKLWANHDVDVEDGTDGEDWVVPITEYIPSPTGIGTATVTFTIPPNGFVASGPDGLLVFSAINPDAETGDGVRRIDYARVPGRWTMICKRLPQTIPACGSYDTDVPKYRGFPSDTEMLQFYSTASTFEAAGIYLFAGATVVHNEVMGKLIGASGGIWWDDDPPGNQAHWEYSAPCGTMGRVTVVDDLESRDPEPDNLAIRAHGDADTLAVNRQLGLTARLEYGTDANGSVIWRDVTTLVDWSTSADPGMGAAVDQNGALSAESTGTVEITATLGSWTSNSLEVEVTAGVPTISVASTLSVDAGNTAYLTSTYSDDEPSPLSAWWNPGDGTTTLAGGSAHHTYHVPGTYAATASVTDQEQNLAFDEMEVTVSATASSVLWADNFGGPGIDGWTWLAKDSAWGLTGGKLKQSLTSTSEQQIGITGGSWATPTVEADITLVSTTSGTALAGIQVCKGNVVDDLSASSGGYYYVAISPDFRVWLYEGGTLKARAGVSSSLSHHLKVLVTAPGTSKRIRVYVDGSSTASLDYVDTTPYTGTAVGLATRAEVATFDNFFVK